VQAAMPGGNVTNLAAPALSLSVCCAYAPADPVVEAFYYREDAAPHYRMANDTTATLAGLRMGLNFAGLFVSDATGSSKAVSACRPYFRCSRSFRISRRRRCFLRGAWACRTTTACTRPRCGALSFNTFVHDLGSFPPPWLTLSADGQISGTPPQAGWYFFWVSISDANGGVGSAPVALRVVDEQAVAILAWPTFPRVCS
jgi:hypothetical protein